jgi:hypothetical protein
MKQSFKQNRRGSLVVEQRLAAMMTRIRSQYLAAGVTPQELAEIERLAATGAKDSAALMIAKVLARLKDDSCGGTGAGT